MTDWLHGSETYAVASSEKVEADGLLQLTLSYPLPTSEKLLRREREAIISNLPDRDPSTDGELLVELRCVDLPIPKAIGTGLLRLFCYKPKS